MLWNQSQGPSLFVPKYLGLFLTSDPQQNCAKPGAVHRTFQKGNFIFRVTKCQSWQGPRAHPSPDLADVRVSVRLLKCLTIATNATVPKSLNSLVTFPEHSDYQKCYRFPSLATIYFTEQVWGEVREYKNNSLCAYPSQVHSLFS